MKRGALGVVAACALACAAPAMAGAQEANFERTIPTSGLNFDVDWTNDDVFTADNTTVRRYNLANGAFETSFAVPSGTINDIGAVNGGVRVATIGASRLYAYNSDGGGSAFTDFNTENRLGDVRGLGIGSFGVYLTTGNSSILSVTPGGTPFGYPQIVAGWGVNQETDSWQNCIPSSTPPPGCFTGGHSGAELGKVTDARDLDVRQNVEGTSTDQLFVLERRGIPGGGTDNRVSVFGHDGTAINPAAFIIGGGPSNVGSGANQFNLPYGIALDVERGRIYIADQLNHRVSVHNFQGTFLQAFGYGVDTGANQLEACTFQSGCQAGTAVAQLNNPLRVQVDPANGDVYVSHLGGISEFSFAGGPVRAPKDVLLEARPMKVERNADTTLTASLLPCAGTRNEPIVFERKDGADWKRVGFREADRNCRGKVTTKVRATTTYRARSPRTNNFKAGTSPTVRVTVRK